jgi:glycosyltransferase involved in cell wall biosynthesis
MTSADRTPVVSVVLTTFRRQDVLARAIESVRQQTLRDWELVVVDDEPSELTRAIVLDSEDTRIRYVAHESNQGLCAARNTGIAHSRGEYLAFLDDDDEFLPRKLELQAALLDRAGPDVGVVSCYEEIVRADGSHVDRSIVLEGNVLPRLLRQDLVRMQLLMVRRSCLDRVGPFDVRLPMHDDFDMTLRLSREYKFTTIRENLVRITNTEGSMSRQVRARAEALEILMNEHPEFGRRRVRSRWEQRLARHYSELGDAARWREHLLIALRAYPLNARAAIALLVGVTGEPATHHRLARWRGQVTRAVRERTR